jgi:uncharacterized Zn finger protein
MCKHIAAVLYGIGARLDQQPDLLFTLRRMKQEDLVARAAAGDRLAKSPSRAASRKRLDDSSLAEVFGIEIAPASDVRPARRSKSSPKPAHAPDAPKSDPSTSTAARLSPPPAVGQPVPTKEQPRLKSRRTFTAAERRAMAARARKRWAAALRKARRRKP